MSDFVVAVMIVVLFAPALAFMASWRP